MSVLVHGLLVQLGTQLLHPFSYPSPSLSPPHSLPSLSSSLPNLEELNLRKCQISDDGISELAKGLIVKRNIKKLSIG